MSKALQNLGQVPFWWLDLPRKTSLLKDTEHPADDPGSSKICVYKGEDMVHGSSITLYYKHWQPQLFKQLQKELYYLLNRGLACSNIPFTTPIEKSKPLSLIEACCGSPNI